MVGGLMLCTSGSYTGDGTSARAIAVGFEPDAVVLQRTDDATTALCATSTMTGAKPFSASGVSAANISALTATGFTVENTASANQSAGAYKWVAWQADADDLAVFTYVGNNTNNRSVGAFTFTGNMAWVLPDTTADPYWRTDQHADQNSQQFGIAVQTGRIASFGAGTVEVDAFINGTGVTYHVIVWKSAANHLAITSYAGDGTDDRDVAHGLGTTPIFALVQCQSTNDDSVVRYKDHVGDLSDGFGTDTDAANQIQAWDATNVQLGTSVRVNNGTGTPTFTLVTFGEDLGVVNPTITSIVPDEGPKAGGTTITITGTGFVAGAAVTVGGAAATGENVINSTTMTAVTPAGTVGAQDVVVTNTDTGTVTEAGGFTYTQSNGWWYWDHARRRRNA